MTGGFSLHTVLVQGRLAYAMRRAAAARSSEFGLQILTVSQFAARLAGGLKRPASQESIEAGIMAALAAPEKLVELGAVHDMPGMTRALVRTLRNVWRSGFDLHLSAHRDEPRIRDLAYIEDVVRDRLAPGEYLLPDLERLAHARQATAGAVLGPLVLDGVHTIDPLWRRLINGLRHHVPVVWRAPVGADTTWFEGEPNFIDSGSAEERAFCCAAPSHEAVEAIRWARSIIASGAAKPHEIAIAATSTAGWDDEFLALAAASSLPFCFVGGRPALATWDGQRCAALADVLHNGLSQARVRRLLSVVAAQGTSLDGLPNRNLPVSSQASLTTASDWERALAAHPQYRAVLAPILRELEKGPAAAVAAAALLPGGARALWDEALRRAPASALMFSLETLRIPDERDPASAIAWCSADQLAAAPRPFVWLLGLTTRDWPRSNRLDPLLPTYLVPPREVDPDPVETADRRCLEIIRRSAKQLMLSTCRLTSEATKASASSLLSARPTPIYRDRIPKHAFSESDRLLARPQDLLDDARTARADEAWGNWTRKQLTGHDGLVGEGHPLLLELFKRSQSPTSLSLLLRDPLAYVWYYALGWRDLVHKERGLILPADDFGRLVHELLKHAVDQLEPRPGFASAVRHEIDDALGTAATKIIASWPAETNVPPPVLWTTTVRLAREMGFSALTLEPFEQPGIRSWTEVPFGGETRDPVSPINLPWDHRRPVTLPGTDIEIVGTIDRLDLWPGASEVRVNDYKTGEKPKRPEQRVLAGGRDLQHVLYDLACRTLLGETPRRSARLIYLRAPVSQFPLNNSDVVIQRLTDWVVLARRTLEAGVVYPGVRPYEDDPRFGRLAMPAAASYFDRKYLAVRDAAGWDLARYWKEK